MSQSLVLFAQYNEFWDPIPAHNLDAHQSFNLIALKKIIIL